MVALARRQEKTSTMSPVTLTKCPVFESEGRLLGRGCQLALKHHIHLVSGDLGQVVPQHGYANERVDLLRLDSVHARLGTATNGHFGPVLSRLRVISTDLITLRGWSQMLICCAPAHPRSSGGHLSISAEKMAKTAAVLSPKVS